MLGPLSRTGTALGLGLKPTPDIPYPHPAPDGYRWQPETYNGAIVSINSKPLFYLQRVS
jgi:hypothetical protein